MWQTYHVPDDHSSATQAFSFCRKCAVHLVHAIDSDPFMVSFNVHCLTTPWKKAKARTSSAFRRVKKKTPRSPANTNAVTSNQAARGITNSQNRGTPNARGGSPPPSPRLTSNSSSPISFDSKLTDDDDKPVKEVVKTEATNESFLSKEDSLSVASDNLSFGNNNRQIHGSGAWSDDELNPFQLRRKPNPRYPKGSSSTNDWPTDTTDASSFLYADDENSLYNSSAASARTDPLPPTVGGTPRHGAGISSNYALREKLRSNLSKHMKQQHLKQPVDLN